MTANPIRVRVQNADRSTPTADPWSTGPDTEPAPSSLDPEALAAAAYAVEQAADSLNLAAVGLTGLIWEDGIVLLDAITKARNLIATIESDLQRHVAQQMADQGVKQIEVEGVGLVERVTSSSRKAWDHEGLAGHVLDAHLTRLDGDIPDPWTVRDWLLSAAAVSYWRVTELKTLGIDVDDFCQTTYGSPSLKITRPG